MLIWLKNQGKVRYRTFQLRKKPSPLGTNLGCRGLWLTEASARRLVLGERKKTADAVLQFFATVEHCKGPALLSSSIVPVAKRALSWAKQELAKAPKLDLTPRSTDFHLTI